MKIAQREKQGSRSTGGIRKAAALIAAAGLALLAASCGNRYFTATVSGYVKEAGDQAGSSGAGINAAEIRVYLKAPTAATLDDYVVKTSTMSSGGQDGYWSHKIMWENWFPSFPDEGDSATVYVWVKRPGYFPVVIAASGILSDSTNVVPTIELERISMATLRGRVVNRFGQGVDGIRLILNLDSSPDLVQDYAATTAQADEGSGYFEFNDIGWIDPDSIPAVSDPGATPSPSPSAGASASPAANISARSGAIARTIAADGSATEGASLYVDDPAYYGAAYTETSPLRITLTSGATIDISTDATRRISVLPAQFGRETMEGRVVDQAGVGLNGVNVSIDLASTTPGADYTVQTVHLEEKPTAQRDGWYRFNRVGWTDQSPEHPAGDAYGDTESLKLYVSDNAYASSVTADAPRTVDLASDTENMTPIAFGVTGDIVAVGTEFSVPGISGRVVDGSSSGMNGVTVTLDLQSTAAKPDASAVTATVDGVAGTYLFPKTTWTDAEAWKTEADPTLWASDTENADLYVVAGTYASAVDELHPLPILLGSGTMTAVTTNIVARAASFRVALIEGRIVNASLAGINGITVTLDLESTAANQDATATTQDNVSGAAGWFRFVDVSWTDTEPETPERERISLRVPEGDWDPIYLSTELTPGTNLSLSGASAIVATRRTYWSYNATVSGRVQMRSAANGLEPLSGIEVRLSAGGTASNLTIASSSVPGGGMVAQTDANGAYSFTLNWTRATDYVPAGPNGGDSFYIDLAFNDNDGSPANDPVGFDEYQVRSWNNPTRMADRFYDVP